MNDRRAQDHTRWYGFAKELSGHGINSLSVNPIDFIPPCLRDRPEAMGSLANTGDRYSSHNL
ncbi:MAG: hypothetical protein AB4352_28055 [Hormoscilla sp.]